VTGSYRLLRGGLVDHGARLRFTFDGVGYEGLAGDTLASALLANGIRLVARSFKYHRPRGVWSAGSDEPNALVELRSGARREPNTRATVVELYPGLEAASQNRWPSLGFDVMAVNGLLSSVLPAGFYYKTFMWPAAFWETVYEPAIRRAAGLGHAAGMPDPDRYEKTHAFCDLLVIGAGPAGLSAALAAARAGARVILADEDSRLGGRLLAERVEVDGASGVAFADAAAAELRSLKNVTVLPRTTVFGLFDHGTYGALERTADHVSAPTAHGVRQRYWKIVARQAVLASGAIERPIAFPGNDLPGVMSAAAVRAYLNRFAVEPGRAAVVFTASDDGWRTAHDLNHAGAAVLAVVDPRKEIAPTLRAGLDPATRIVLGGAVVKASGGSALRSVTMRAADGTLVTLSADLLAVSGGWSAAVHLGCHLGARPVWDEASASFRLPQPPPGLRLAGAADACFSLSACLAGGADAGATAASELGFTPAARDVPSTADEPSAVKPYFFVADAKGQAFVDPQTDVTTSDIALAAREGFQSVEHTKRYTTLGMGTDQGKVANVVGIAVLADALGRSIAETGTTVFRPPYTPVAIGALAGRHRGKDYRPARYTPTHDLAVELGASFMQAGAWYRAEWYARPGETGWRDSVDREALTVRNAVGICDVSTLGKIEVVGKDAAAFLDFVYANNISNLAVGRIRYGLMLREDGFVFDDGTAARLGEDRFFVTTTTVNAAKVLQHMEFCHQLLRPELDLTMLTVTDRWAQFSIAGPKSRELIARLVDPPFDLSNAAFPHMSAAEITACGGAPARLYRMSFSGELAYEIGVPADLGAAFMRRALALGADLGVAPYGTEALGVLRIEKGHVAGTELDGRTTAFDLGLDKMLSTKKDFIGRRMAARPALVDPSRACLVGLKPVDRATVLRSGAHLLEIGATPSLANDLGHVSAAAYSPTLGHMVALALVSRGRERHGERLRFYDPLRGGDALVDVTGPIFIDPDGARTRA
jgi:heterotetrameric sarcosine oxidase alpha subunit